MRGMKRSWHRGAWPLLAAGLMLGCYSPQFKDCEIQCGPSIACPGGMTCQAGLCTKGRQCPRTDAGAGAKNDAADAGMDLPGDLSSDLPLLEVAPDRSLDLPLAPPDVAPDT